MQNILLTTEKETLTSPQEGLNLWRPKQAHENFDTAFGRPRNFLDNRFVYAVISQRAHGLSVGVNLNPDKGCNFNCIYCEVNRLEPGRAPTMDTKLMSVELQNLLTVVFENKLRHLPAFRNLPEELL